MTTAQKPAVAVLGLGVMGSAVASRLLDTGYSVTVWNRTPGKAAPLAERGAIVAGTPSEAVGEAGVVLTLLTNDAAVEAVSLGENGVAHKLRDEATLVDMSTVHPDTSRKLAREARSGKFVDAPILGGPEVTQAGKARLLLGGRKEVVEALDDLWNDLAAGHFYCGENGSATTLKLLSNLILVGGTALLAEAVVTGQAHGISTDVLREVFGGSPAVAPGVRVRLDDILEGDHHGWWTLTLAEKDIRLVLKLAEAKGVELPMGSTMEHMIKQANQSGYADLDLAGIVELLRSVERV